MIKASMESLETKLFLKSDDTLLFLSPGGVIFISNNDELKNKFLWEPDEQILKAIVDSKQFGAGPWGWSGFSKDKYGNILDKNSVKYMLINFKIKNYPGWQIINLRNYKQIAQQVSKPFVRIVGPIIFFILITTGILAIILYQSGIKAIAKRKKIENQLNIAKTKLSQYSLDLEKQVKNRTAELEKAQDNLKNLSKNIIDSQEREKAQVAGELHDHLGQVLTALRIDAVWAEKLINRTDKNAGKRIQQMCSLIDDTINDVREMAYRLRPRVLDDLGLTDALESLLLDFEKHSNVSCVFKHDTIPEISDTLTTALYRISQEAVTNAIRHSNATTIFLELTTDKEGIILSIQDNGCGFDFDNNDRIKGFGLEGMKERANLAGGSLEIISQASIGTKICCKIKHN